MPEDPTSLRVLLPNADAAAERMGMTELPEDVRSVEPGQQLATDSLVAAVPASMADAAVGDVLSNNHFDIGELAPLGGATFGMAVLSTPNATVAGQSANPIVTVDTAELLQREAATRMLQRGGVTDADEVSWAAGPMSVPVNDLDGDGISLLGETAEVEAFEGVVTGAAAPWGVGLVVARVTPDDHVIAVGVYRRPLATAEMGDGGIMGSAERERSAELFAETVERLEME